jgi:hypothetical protein
MLNLVQFEKNVSMFQLRPFTAEMTTNAVLPCITTYSVVTTQKRCGGEPVNSLMRWQIYILLRNAIPRRE